MSNDQLFIAAGAYLYGALALVGVFVLGIYTGDLIAAKAAVGSAGFAYAAQFAGANESLRIAIALTLVSVVLGVVGFAAILF